MTDSSRPSHDQHPEQRGPAQHGPGQPEPGHPQGAFPAGPFPQRGPAAQPPFGHDSSAPAPGRLPPDAGGFGPGPHAGPAPRPGAPHPGAPHPDDPGYGPMPTAPTTPNVLGIIAIVLGALALVGTVLVIGGLLRMNTLFVLLLAFSGIVLAIMGLVQRRRSKPPAVIGLVVSVLALIAPFAIMLVGPLLFG
ncbi:MAG: hypothetical protein GXX90_01855 [Microbacteriaceae bacterium]|nr:hypothetical protein [Microbacteriaceae bacterium]